MKWNKINGFHVIIDSCFCSKVKTAQIHTHEQNTTNHIEEINVPALLFAFLNTNNINFLMCLL